MRSVCRNITAGVRGNTVHADVTQSSEEWPHQSRTDIVNVFMHTEYFKIKSHSDDQRRSRKVRNEKVKILENLLDNSWKC